MVVALWLIMPVRKEMNVKKANLEKLKMEHAALDKELKELRKEYPSPFYWAPFVLMDAEN